jgi:hypothetical protein
MLDEGIAAHVVGHGADAIAGLQRLQHAPALLRARGEGFFADDVLPVLECERCLRRVKRVRRTDVHDVHFGRSQQLLE